MSDLPGQPNLSQFAETVLEAAGEQMRVGIPGVIKGVNSDNSKASVQPAVKRAGSDSDPELPDVPLLFPVFGRVKITWPVESGDPCWILFGDRSLEEWESKGGDGEVEPEDSRTHDLTDAVALPFGIGGASLTRTSDITLSLGNLPGLDVAGSAELRIQDDGTVALGNSSRTGTYKDFTNNDQNFTGTAELVDLLVQLLDILMRKQSGNPSVYAGSSDGVTTPTWMTESAYNAVAPLRAKLDAIKGSL